MSISPERVLFIHGAKNIYTKTTLQTLTDIYVQRKECPYAIINGAFYTMTNLISGRECNFDLKRMS